MTTLHFHRRRGFTLIEVLMVLVILVILMSLAVTTYTGMHKRALVDATKVEIGIFESALENYHLSLNSYPSTTQGLQALRVAPSDLPDQEKWDGPYLNKDIPMDPWGHPYNYASPGNNNRDTFDVWSAGPDGIAGTADDIGNWTR
jgi:general secretion pathway protein G